MVKVDGVGGLVEMCMMLELNVTRPDYVERLRLVMHLSRLLLLPANLTLIEPRLRLKRLKLRLHPQVLQLILRVKPPVFHLSVVIGQTR